MGIDPGRVGPHRGDGRSALEWIDLGILWLAKHWLALCVGWIAIAVSLPTLAPVFRASGWRVPADALYLLYRPLCHQRADRSFHFMGEKMAFCQRNLAIFLGLGIVALVFPLVMPRLISRGISRWLLAALTLPIVLDGGTQLVGLRESTMALRLITGGLFGVGAALWLLPALEEGFGTVRRDIEYRMTSTATTGEVAKP